jgi:excisionase family DNA binding protein
MVTTLSKISSEQLCLILGVTDLRTLESTGGFPKPFFDDEKMMFNKDEVAKYFNVNDIDEPFITLKEAAEYLNLKTAYVQSLAIDNEVPSYRLKAVKGSGYLFRKSELDFLKVRTLHGNENFINYFIGDDKIRDLFKLFLKEHFKDDENSRSHDILKLYFFDKNNFTEIAKKWELSKERIRQLFEISYEKLRYRIKESSQINVSELKRKIINQDIEIKYLKSLLDKKSAEGYQQHSKELDAVCDIFIQILNNKISNEDISVRAINTLHNIDIYTIYDLIISYNSYTSHHKFDGVKSIHKLRFVRGIGKNTANEIIDFVKIKEKELEKFTGINSEQFLTDRPTTDNNKVLFEKIHKKMFFIKGNGQ